MSYEINIIVVNQKKRSYLPFESSILINNEVDNYGTHRYAEIWPFFSNTQGILYELVCETDAGYFSSFPLCDSDFEIKVSKNLFPEWASNEDRYYLTPLLIRENFYQDFVKIISFLIDESPDKTIMFQTRYQGGDKEIILGVLKISKFMEMLIKKQILFNVCYIIECD